LLNLFFAAQGQEEFDFEYPNYGEHIASSDPEFVKVLVRYNPESGNELNQRQASKVAELGQYLARNNRKYLFELLVQATKEQLER